MGTPTGTTTPTPWARRSDRLRTLAGDDLQPLGIAPLIDAPVLYTGDPDGRWDWIFMPVEDDPLYQRGQLAIPARITRKLHRLHTTGITFDAYLIGHEVPKHSLADPDPKTLEHVLTRLPSAPHTTLEALTSALAATPSLAGAALAAISDPILIGALTQDATRRPHVPAAHYLIARW
ncbi:hypothetical protein [Acidipropionibacterium acidipropionici]|uniref:hypothetical protein n=1 Tax=Acidipropionibacterium acidipropionici TaxID=1748 RepID=UPI00110B3EBF|nr:hypothetical protein [Acidipropionibacterium acidipropionici]QCV96510.1 hypothetical protein FEZ30_15750 [Acidipropionibacterium acidipropionici]